MGETLLGDSAMAVSDRPSDRSVESFSEQASIDINARQHLLATYVSCLSYLSEQSISVSPRRLDSIDNEAEISPGNGRGASV
jgi:hypothetical protein